MLSPQSEASRDDALFRFGLDSRGRYAGFVEDLEAESGISVEYRSDGVLVLASSDEEFRALEEKSAWQTRAGLRASLLAPADILKLEPGLTMELAGGLWCPDDHQVRPRLLVSALEQAARIRGVTIRRGSVETVVHGPDRAHGVRIDGAVETAGLVVIAAGVGTSEIDGAGFGDAMRPRKGQILSLGMPGPFFRHAIRWRNFYLVPRNDHSVVVGATNEDRGNDRSVTPAGLGGLLNGAQCMSRHVSQFPILETWAGLRPMLPDGLPAIGPGAIEGLHVATGHYRNGILLTPGTVALVQAQLSGSGLPEFAASLEAGRWMPASDAPSRHV
jgi:glycine oxidase